MALSIQAFLEPISSTFSYVIADTENKKCAVIDSVLDYEINSARTSTSHADEIIEYIQDHQYHLEWILETHIHADHLSAATYIKQKLGGRIGVSKHIHSVFEMFHPVYDLSPATVSQFDYFFEEDEDFELCGHQALALYVPGHTPADIAFKVGEHIFVGDTLFATDIGTARCDFPGGNAYQLYKSIMKILAFPNSTKIYLCHDYPPTYRSHEFLSTVDQQKKENIHIKQEVDKTSFVHMRQQRDSTLSPPQLLIYAIQINLAAGKFPPTSQNGVQYLKIPLNQI